MTGEGSARRLTPEQEQTGWRMFADGATDRQVADALGCGAGTANRLRHRAPGDSAGAAEAPVPSVADAGGDVIEADADEYGTRMGELQMRRAEQADVVVGLEQRRATSAAAHAQLHAEQLAELAEGRADVGLRQRARNAADDAADWSTAAEIARSKLADTDAAIAQLESGKRLEDAEREYAASMAKSPALMARAPTVYRSAAEQVSGAAQSVIEYRQEVRDLERQQQAASHARAAARIAAGLPDDRPMLGGSVNGQPNMNRQAPSLRPVCPVVIREGRHLGDPVIALYAAVDRGDLAAIRRALADADEAAWQAAGPQPAGPVVDGAAVRPAPLANQSLSRSRQDMPGFEAAKPPPWIGNQQASVNIDRAGFTDAPPAGLTRLGQQLAAPAAPARE